MLYIMTAEATLMKLVYTPGGFTRDEIRSILAQSSLEEKWRRCARLASERPSGKKQHAANVWQKLNDMIDKLIVQEITLRNKLAHGQVMVPFSRNMNVLPENDRTRRRMSELDYTIIDTSFYALDHLSHIFLDLIQSPAKAHFRDYWSHITQLEDDLEKRSNHSVDKARIILLRKQRKPLDQDGQNGGAETN